MQENNFEETAPGNDFTGKLLGNVAEVFGRDVRIEIKDISANNIRLIINKGQDSILCSKGLSNHILENSLFNNLDEIKKYAVFEFDGGARYVTTTVNSIARETLQEIIYEIGLKKMDLVEEHLQAIRQGIIDEESKRVYQIKDKVYQSAISRMNEEMEKMGNI